MNTENTYTAAGGNLPHHIIIALAADPRFGQCIEESLKTPELVENFERLYDVRRPRMPASPMEAIVDKVTGYADSEWRKFFTAFITFVYDAIYIRVCENHISVEGIQ
ncbi:hypothetical protein [Serratia sp. 1D1416]|uniref:hypothetical protein n=1 Tax=Serratia sp. 1D1416 TaxID=2447890 RepID=UPI001A932D2F|nr:hypothetical protein [Serratia sp. 1D1416]